MRQTLLIGFFIYHYKNDTVKITASRDNELPISDLKTAYIKYNGVNHFTYWTMSKLNGGMEPNVAVIGKPIEKQTPTKPHDMKPNVAVISESNKKQTLTKHHNKNANMDGFVTPTKNQNTPRKPGSKLKSKRKTTKQ